MEKRTVKTIQWIPYLLKHSSLLLLVFFTSNLLAQNILDKGTNIINYKKLQHFQFKKEGLGYITSDKSKTPEDCSLTVETIRQPDFIYNLSARIPIYKTKIKAGEILLLTFEAKTNHALLETGEARTLWMLSVSDNPKDRIRNTISIASDWQQYYLPIPITQNIAPKDLFLALQFGFPSQQFLLKNFKLLVFDRETNIADLPKTKITYQGMEEDAPWRKLAEQRIAKHRMGDFKIKFTRRGKPVKKLPIQITLKRHHFSWGAAIGARTMNSNPAHLKHFKEAFNLAVFENDLKIKFWNKPNRQEEVLKTMEALNENDIKIKGHVLIWPGFRHLTPTFKKNKNNPDKIIKMMNRHVHDVLIKTKGKIDRWDVVNEAYTNQDLQTITGSEDILFEGFKTLAKKDKTVLRYTNEYGIISKGGLDTKKQQWYYDYIKRIDEQTNGLVDGIGIQCHIGSDLTPPEKVGKILDYYATLGKKISISEFTMAITDPEVREQYTKDFITMAFSHPAVYEFLFWGYNTEKADIFTSDWKHGTMGKAFFSLVHDQWKTNIVEDTNTKGCIRGNGFFGQYEYTYVQDNKVLKGYFNFLPNQTNTIDIELP